MKTIEYRTDKLSWDRGEWDSEPDKIQWPDEVTGLPCLIVRHETMGFLCGYVGVAPGHPYYEKSHYSEGPGDLEVHGELTFSSFCNAGQHGKVCHEVEEGEEEKVWWFGFDCAHMWDVSPGMQALPGMKDMNKLLRSHELASSYKNIQFVKAECACLAKQLKEMEKRDES